MDPEEGGEEGLGPLENLKAIWYLSNAGPDPPKNHEATMPVSIVGALSPTSKKQNKNNLNAISLECQWWPPPLVVLSSHLPLKNFVRVELDPYWQNFLELRMKSVVESYICYLKLQCKGCENVIV